MDFSINFGISPEVRKAMQDCIAANLDYERACNDVFPSVPKFQLLKLYQYFDWADKRLH